jgi:hypothetical protein
VHIHIGTHSAVCVVVNIVICIRMNLGQSILSGTNGETKIIKMMVICELNHNIISIKNIVKLIKLITKFNILISQHSLKLKFL